MGPWVLSPMAQKEKRERGREGVWLLTGSIAAGLLYSLQTQFNFLTLNVHTVTTHLGSTQRDFRGNRKRNKMFFPVKNKKKRDILREIISFGFKFIPRSG